MQRAAIGFLLLALAGGSDVRAQGDVRQTAGPGLGPETVARVEAALVARHGEGVRERAARGVRQAAALWRPRDGDPAAFEAFALASFAADAAARDALFARMEFVLESLDGHLLEVVRDLRRQSDLDLGPLYPFDEVLAGYDPGAHLLDDLFTNRIAFTVLLNFPLTTLEERLEEGASWTRRQWAETRLAERFERRVPADVNLAVAKAGADSAAYIASYNVYMHHLVDGKGRRLFPPGMRLLSHWNLRDQVKADYREGAEGLERQRTVQKVMERIVTQTIPAAVVNDPRVDWNPFTNEVRPSTVDDAGRAAPAGTTAPAGPEPDTRYATLLSTFRAERLVDPYSPTAPTHIARKFDEDRQIPEARVKAMLEAVLSSPLRPKVAALVKARLGRPLEPFDVWYDGFRPRPATTEARLDEIVRKRYPTAEAFGKDIPRILRDLGFPPERADLVAANIVVDPARGSGHAWGAARRDDKAHLRTRVGKDGMDYKGYNIAVHELGHNVEQTFSLKLVDHTLLAGVPNTAFTEALAFVFQAQDLKLLGLSDPGPQDRALSTLNDYWATCEIAGVALVDMAAWRWMYDHPEATPAELKGAVLSIARDVWNRYYAPVFGVKDVVLLAIYSHMIDSFLYLPDYPLGHLIAFQVERQMEKAGKIGPEFERMATQGRLTPDLWMTRAVGTPVGPEALLAATAEALTEVGGRR